MNGTLIITLTLAQTDCVRGESVFFEVVIKNVSKNRIDGLPTLAAPQKSVVLEIAGRNGTRRAHQLSAMERDGIHRHADRGAPPTTSLDPGQAMSLRDDLLSWFGELEPGTYQVTARHGKGTISDAVPLEVLPANPVLVTTPRYAAQGPAARLSAAWVHKADDKFVLFYQHQSPVVPRNPIHGIRVVELEEAPTALYAPTLSGADVAKGHLLWSEKRGRLMVTGVNWETPRLGSGSEVVLPFKGSPLASPLSMADGRLLIPFAGPRKRKVAILQVSPDASIQPFQLDLGKVKPLGPYVCFWEYDARLHFAWSAPKGREIILGRLPLDDPAAGFPTRSVYLSDAPILWIDAYLDTDGPSQEAPYLEEMIPPDQRDKVPPPPSPGVVLWCVTDSPSGLKCTRVNVSQGQGKPATTLPTGGAKDLRVLGSVVTYEFELAMLLADAEDKLYYASTIRGSVEPLADVAGVDITLGEFPALIRASGHARTPWVYLRYVKDKKSIDYIRLEPADERDPVERGNATKPSRRRGR